MSETKHTPGPWRCGGTVGHAEWIVADAGPGRLTQIAMVYGPSVTPGSADNASLIAAAPELLAELRALVAGIERTAATGLALSGYVGTGRALELIARAEGRS